MVSAPEIKGLRQTVGQFAHEFQFLVGFSHLYIVAFESTWIRRKRVNDEDIYEYVLLMTLWLAVSTYRCSAFHVKLCIAIDIIWMRRDGLEIVRSLEFSR